MDAVGCFEDDEEEEEEEEDDDEEEEIEVDEEFCKQVPGAGGGSRGRLTAGLPAQEGPRLASQGPGGPALAFVGTSEWHRLVLIGTVFQ